MQGGMRAVIWTDVFQFLTMVGGMLAILVKVRILNSFHLSYNICYCELQLILSTSQKSER